MLTTLDAALKRDPLEAACVPANYTNVVQERRSGHYIRLVADDAGIHGKRLSALAHPIRLHILSVAESEDISASEVAVALTEPLGVVAYHFRVLHTAGLIELVGTQRRRGSIQSFYRATTTGWSDLTETVEQLIGK